MAVNWEHSGDEKGPSSIVGKVIFAKKIYTEGDCENDLQRAQWKQIKLPFITGIVRLFDGAGHPQAQAIAAIIRDNVANGEPISCRWSVEGSTLEKEGNRLKQSVVRRLACTIKPCNRTATSDLIEDPNAPEGFEKKHTKEKVKDLLDFEDSAKSENPLYQRLGGTTEINSSIIESEPLTKDALSAGSYAGAPGSLVGGAALQREDLGRKVFSAYKKYSKDKKDFDKAEFKEFLRSELPEASEEFLDHFRDAVDDIHVKQGALKKKEAAKVAAPTTAPTAAPKAAPKVAEPDEEDAAPVKIANGTIRGIPTQPVKMKGYHFDEEKGILHTPKGSFPLYNPDKGFETKTVATKGKPFYKDGALHVPAGTDMSKVPANGPNPGFRELYTSKPIEEFHTNKVMPNWARVHELTKNGKLPEEVVMHAAVFSMLSPNTPIRPHELMYSHMADTFEDLGIDARDPDFKKAKKHWMMKDQGTNYPRNAGEYFKEQPDVHLSNDSEGKGRKAGELMSFMLGENKFKNIAQYHKLHSTLVDMVKRHGTDARAASAELMKHKAAQVAWKAQRQQFKSKVAGKAKVELGLANHKSDYIAQKIAEARAAGGMGPKGASVTGDSQKKKAIEAEADKLGLKDDLQAHAEAEAHKKFGEYQGVPIPGLAPKTGRFAFTMLGGGNSFVPDTHIVRHLFGMDTDHDSHTLAYLKSVLWNANNHHILEGIDRWYAKNHPAAQIMQKHPIYGHHFKDDPEQANFPAFWRHWTSIAQDERNRGIANGAAANEGSTHMPFWMGIDKFVNPVKKSEAELDDKLHAKLLALHAQYRQDHGEVPAQMMFFAHLVPHLLEASRYREEHDDLPDFAKSVRADVLDIQLRKATSDLAVAALADPKIPTVHALRLRINGKEHRAGRFMLHDGDIHHLEDYYGLLKRFLPEGPLTTKEVSTIHGMKMSPHLSLTVETPPAADKPPESAAATPLVDTPMPQASPRPPSVFEYHRAGMDNPHTLEVHSGQYLLDGNRLTHPEVQTILSNAHTGRAKLRYKTGGVLQQIQKMEAQLQDLLQKAENFNMDPGALLQYMRAAEDAGHLPKGSSAAATKHIYEDSMTPGMGNKKAWLDFAAKKQPGTYIQMDGNNFKALNDTMGHEAGDSAIQAFGKAAREAMDESVGDVHGKLFRSGGDEFVAHVPSHEHAAKFARSLSSKLEKMPPIQGHHQLSMAFGFGHTAHVADQAMYEAKKQKIDPKTGQDKWKIGQVPNLAHSLVPGNEGPLPVTQPKAAAVSEILKPTPAPTPAATPEVAPTPGSP